MVANIMQKICIKKESYLRRNNFIYILLLDFYVFITIKERLLMKRTLLFSLLLTLALPLNAQTLEGKWKLNPVAGSLGVGPNPGDYSWWSIDASTVTTRACLYDDEYIFYNQILKIVLYLIQCLFQLHSLDIQYTHNFEYHLFQQIMHLNLIHIYFH